MKYFPEKLSYFGRLGKATALALVLLMVMLINSGESYFYFISKDFLAIICVSAWIHYFEASLKDVLKRPNTMLIGVGVLNALFILSVSFQNFINHRVPGIAPLLFKLYMPVLCIGVAYILSVFKLLYFYRQKKDARLYFNTMMFFIVIAAFLSDLLLDPDILTPMKIVVVLLIVFNSLRVQWIAFLPKKEKKQLLLISVILCVLFISGGSYLSENQKMLYGFSKAIYSFLSLLAVYGSVYTSIIFFTTLFHIPTAEAFDRKAEEVSSLMYLNKMLTQVFDFRELADTITQSVMKISGAEASWLMTSTSGHFELSSVRNLGFIEAEKISSSLIKRAGNELTSRTVYTESLKELNLNFKSIAVSSLRLNSAVNGYLFALSKDELGFDEDEKKAVGTLADYASLALENARLIKESLEKERIDRELEVAREAQYKLLPQKLPDLEQLNISAVFVPALEVGGDYYDFFRLGDDRLGFVIADASGKGIPAAFIMAEMKGIFETLSRLITDPKELLIRANELLKGSLEKKYFVTAIYGVINLKTGILRFARAGHNPLLLCRRGEVKKYQPKGMGLGLCYGKTFNINLEEEFINLKKGDCMLLYTDGITEAQNAAKENFGLEKIETILRDAPEDVNEISRIIMKDVSIHQKETSQHDDITLLAFNWVKNISGEE